MSTAFFNFVILIFFFFNEKNDFKLQKKYIFIADMRNTLREIRKFIPPRKIKPNGIAHGELPTTCAL